MWGGVLAFLVQGPSFRRLRSQSEGGRQPLLSLWFPFLRFSRERASREESWERGRSERSERGATDWRLESSNGKTALRRSEEKEAGEI